MLQCVSEGLKQTSARHKIKSWQNLNDYKQTQKYCDDILYSTTEPSGKKDMCVTFIVVSLSGPIVV